MTLNYGDPVTLVTFFTEMGLRAGTVTVAPDARGVFTIHAESERAQVTTSALLCEEGINWIRGHHEPGSPEFTALRAAFALAGRW